MIRDVVENPIVARQIELNRSTAHNWTLFTGHRQHVMALILSSRPVSASSLCVLGAGNCNDLDLAVLTKWFAEIHLVDIDDEALALAMSHQGMDNCGSIVLHGGVDITGVAGQMATWCTKAPTEREIDAVLGQMGRVSKLGVGQPHDVVVSSAILTQLIASVATALGTDHSRLLDLTLAIRTAHIRLLADLVSTGGVGVLLSDLVSSDTCEELGAVPEDGLLDLMRHLLAQRNFFAGANPFAIREVLREDSYIAPQVKEIVLTRPWRWRVGPERAYLVCAVTFRKV